MQQGKYPDLRKHAVSAATKAASQFIATLPVIIGMLLLTGLILQVLPQDRLASWFGHDLVVDASIGALAGSIAAGHPVTSYILGGELLQQGVSLVAVTALLVSWVTVGSVQLPAEALMLGRRFAIYRNLICFFSSILVALATVATLQILD